ncbi:MAG: RNA methyltransferase [Clostridiales bacterium]|nr:RNA methyltransferase [Clostridiales bacterium]
MEKITGKNNAYIKDVKKLFSSSRERRSQQLFVLEGARLVFDVLNSFYEIDSFLITNDAYEKYRDLANQMIEKSKRSFIISEEISEKLSDTKNSQGVFAVCKMRQNDFVWKCNGKYIALDNVQDPGNLGTIVRTAEALGIDGVLIGGGCDCFNPKVLRSAMGSMLRVNILRCDNLADLLEKRKKSGMMIYGTSPNNNAVKITDIDFNCGCICVIGNEASGISDEIKNISTSLITIPMLGNAESLNASVAASIVMWEMLR